MDRQYPLGNKHLLPCGHIYEKDFAKIAKRAEEDWVINYTQSPLFEENKKQREQFVRAELKDGKISVAYIGAKDAPIIICQICGVVYVMDILLKNLIQNEVTAESIRESAELKEIAEKSLETIKSLEVS